MTDKTPGQIDIRLPLPSGLTNTRLPAGTHAVAGADNGEADEALDLIELVREKLEIEATVPDVTIAASLAQIAAKPELRDRWLAAFGSPLGKHLAVRGSDLNTLLNVLLALAPRQIG
ncbi:MAG: hypothetical protein JSS20_14790 [Proteobacteria bacterium]|nr:hypothetical protein [Pseudomonadota bacterium]